MPGINSLSGKDLRINDRFAIDLAHQDWLILARMESKKRLRRFWVMLKLLHNLCNQVRLTTHGHFLGLERHEYHREAPPLLRVTIRVAVPESLLAEQQLASHHSPLREEPAASFRGRSNLHRGRKGGTVDGGDLCLGRLVHLREGIRTGQLLLQPQLCSDDFTPPSSGLGELF